MTRNKKAALHNLGCKVNSYETQMMEQELKANGYEIVDFSEVADVYVINTCSVTNIADRKSRQMLSRAHELNPEACVVACGCYVETAGVDVVAALDYVDIVIGNDRKKELIPLLNQFWARRDGADITGEKIVEAIDINKQGLDYCEFGPVETAEHTRAFMKIQDGCNQFCTYCIIPFARGRIRSRKPLDVMSEARMLADKGFKEVVLTGIHLTSYGSGENFTLMDIIEAIAAIPGIERIRLGSLEPGAVDEEFASRLSKIDKLCPHFHMSLQSGCDSVLKRMNRKYTTEEFLHSVGLLRQYFDNPAITTDVIAGFPGETEEEHEATKQFVEKVAFAEMHIFPYSRRKGTAADRMPDQLTEKVKKARAGELIAIGKRLSEEYILSSMGRAAKVLLEEEIIVDGKHFYTGFTPEYIKVKVPEEIAKKSIPEGKKPEGEIIVIELNSDMV